MTTHEEAEATVHLLPGGGFGFYVRPAVPPVPDGYELVEDDGVPAFRAPTDDDYGYLDLYGVVDAGDPSPAFGGRRYIVRQSVPTEVERLARLLAVEYGMPWEHQSTYNQEYYVAQAQRLLDHGVRCPDQTQD